jgi:hypothetical protein
MNLLALEGWDGSVGDQPFSLPVYGPEIVRRGGGLHSEDRDNGVTNLLYFCGLC